VLAVPFALLATNVVAGFAVWYEPEPDPAIDDDVASYEKMFGPGNFYSTAPRVTQWSEFKRVIEEFESGIRVCKPLSRDTVARGLGKISSEVKAERGQGCLSVVLGLCVLVTWMTVIWS
jgi:hypothetical protein